MEKEAGGSHNWKEERWELRSRREIRFCAWNMNLAIELLPQTSSTSPHSSTTLQYFFCVTSRRPTVTLLQPTTCKTLQQWSVYWGWRRDEGCYVNVNSKPHKIFSKESFLCIILALYWAAATRLKTKKTFSTILRDKHLLGCLKLAPMRALCASARHTQAHILQTFVDKQTNDLKLLKPIAKPSAVLCATKNIRFST